MRFVWLAILLALVALILANIAHTLYLSLHGPPCVGPGHDVATAYTLIAVVVPATATSLAFLPFRSTAPEWKALIVIVVFLSLIAAWLGSGFAGALACK